MLLSDNHNAVTRNALNSIKFPSQYAFILLKLIFLCKDTHNHSRIHCWFRPETAVFTADFVPKQPYSLLILSRNRLNFTEEKNTPMKTIFQWLFSLLGPVLQRVGINRNYGCNRWEIANLRLIGGLSIDLDQLHLLPKKKVHQWKQYISDFSVSWAPSYKELVLIATMDITDGRLQICDWLGDFRLI